MANTPSTTPNKLTVTGTDSAHLTINGAVGPAGASGTITTSTSTNLTGYIFGNGTNIAGATTASSSEGSGTLVIRDTDGSFGTTSSNSDASIVGVNTGNGGGLVGTSQSGAGGLSITIDGNYHHRLKTADITANRDWTLPNESGTVALDTTAVMLTGNQTIAGTKSFTGAVESSNASIKLTALPTYASEAAAVTAGLASGRIYKTSTGELRIKL
jgi:hypothetical protein